MIDEGVVLLSVEEQNCEHVANNDEWVVDSADTHHVCTKELFTMYKVGDFGT